MHVYQSFEKGLWTVGHYDPSGKFHPYSDHSNEAEAAARVIELNGGCPENSVRLDAFAAAALTGLLAYDDDEEGTAAQIASQAFALADAMIRESKKGGSK